MTATQMIERRNWKPFDAFEVNLADGANIKVKEPWQISTPWNSPVCVTCEADAWMRIISLSQRH